MSLQYRQQFDPARDFVIVRQIKLDGEVLEPGQTFRKTRVSIRRLRQLFDQRAVGYPNETGRDRCRPPHPKRDILRKDWSDEQIAADNGVALEPKREGEIEIPQDWRLLKWPALLHLASQFSAVRVMNKLEAEASIVAELNRRGGTA